jgi:hypothetical protein
VTDDVRAGRPLPQGGKLARLRWSDKSISRRDFLRGAALGLAGVALMPRRWTPDDEPVVSDEHRLGRVCVGKVDLKAGPSIDSETVGVLYEDAVVDWLRERTGSYPFRTNQRWVETPDGYIWFAYVQPVRDLPNAPVSSLPATSLGEGMWTEVSVPWVDLSLANPPARSPWLKLGGTPRLYYSQVLWVDQVRVGSEGGTLYRVNERYGYGDMFWVPAEALRPLTDEELAPISPEAEDKHVIVDLLHQSLSCMEGSSEVYYCRISSGAKFDSEGNAVDKWATPVGPHPIWRKVISLHMSGGTTGGGYDLPGIGYTTLFAGNGVAIHSTFWHNNFGEPMSHGCVNARPEDARWVFRWTAPTVALDPGDITVGMPGGTSVRVVED